MNRVGVGEVRISHRAMSNVLTVLKTGRLSYGPFSREFERRFAELHGKKFACFMNSGTSALQVALHALKEKYGWKDGDRILVPALTFVASVNVILQNGLVPVFVDVDRFYGMDPRWIPEHVAGAVGVMPVHLFGQPADPIITSVAKSFDLRVIDDSCETMGVPHCADGEVSCFSTYACHLICTGVGGFVLTDDPETAMLVRSLANHGRSGIYTGIDDVLGARETIAARFSFERVGYSYRATEVEAAIGCAEMDDWSKNVSARRYNAAILGDALSDLPIELPATRPGGSHAWMMYPVLAQDRDELEMHLERSGIETRRMLPLTCQPYFKQRFGDIEDQYPMSKRVNDTGLYVGCHQFLTNDDLGRISSVFHDFYR